MRRAAAGAAALLGGLVAAAAAGAAAPSIDASFCRNGVFTREQDSFGLARVTGAGRLRLRVDLDGCPDPARACPGYGYVVPGDRVITGRSLGRYVCAYVPNRSGGSAGWVERARLRPEPVPAAPAVAAWIGRWRDGDDGIRLTRRRDGSLRADGGAYWPSRDPPASVAPGGPHLGSLGAQGRPQGARVHLAEGEDASSCVVDLWLVAPSCWRATT